MEMMGERINYENDWIIESGCFNHMTGDQLKLQDMKEYKGSHMVLTANNTRLPILEKRRSCLEINLIWYEEELVVSITTNIIRKIRLVWPTRCEGISRS
uniref:Retrovirus-related Pol polyprotein from transposon TNT 1-94-like beta-barrel domain-containing protein n=1 Tax=Lactuca sativa TaxID=4236 RepID=A0A9R1VDP6_LACSA|nr:hypothetical protein LSAT_V11C500296620 [Lactuca sativa]